MIPLGNGQIALGDCLDVMRSIPAGSVDMILCDLPYGTTACSWDSVIPFEPLWREYWRIAKPNAAVVLTAAQPFTAMLIMSQIDRFKYEWIWEKSKATGHGNVKRQPMRSHENVLTFYREQCKYTPQMTEGEPYKGRKNFKDNRDKGHGWYNSHRNDNDGKRYPRTSLFFANEYPQSIIHPTQKPVALFEYLIKTYTNPGDTVMDNCIGSGTTAIAAENTGRRWIGIERNPTYFGLACERIARHANGVGK